jgi:cobalamin biosynthesis protein CobD/CbiB
MKVKIPLALLLLLASAMGYLMGTEAGREQRDSLIRIIRRQKDVIEAEAEAATETVAESASDAVDAAVTAD